MLDQDQITSQFDQIGATVNSGGGAGIAGSAEFVTLKSMLHFGLHFEESI